MITTLAISPLSFSVCFAVSVGVALVLYYFFENSLQNENTVGIII